MFFFFFVFDVFCAASAKRSHESWISASSGGEELNFRQRSNSPGGQSVEPASPSSSNVSLRKKMVCVRFCFEFFKRILFVSLD